MRYRPKLAIVMALLVGAAVAGQAPPANVARAAANSQEPYVPEKEDAKARKYFTDTQVIDQNGRKLRFYSDVLRGRTVLISLFYTNCTGICPIVNDALSQVQDELGDRQGKDIVLISVSLDPETDRPEAMAEYAQRFEPAEGWYFLTGEPDAMAEIIRLLGHTGPIEAHTGLLMLGNVTEGVWTRVYPNTPPTAIAAKLKTLSDGGFRTPGG